MNFAYQCQLGVCNDQLRSETSCPNNDLVTNTLENCSQSVTMNNLTDLCDVVVLEEDTNTVVKYMYTPRFLLNSEHF